MIRKRLKFITSITVLFGLIGFEPLIAAGHSRGMSRKVLQKTRNAIVEVVVPKRKDRTIYADSIPKNAFHYAKRKDKFHSIGTAFFTGKNTLISAAHVFSLHKYQGYSHFYIRTTRGKIYKVQDITRYDMNRDIIEFNISGNIRGIKPLKMYSKYQLGAEVCAPGNARGEGISIRCSGELAMRSKEPAAGRWLNLRFSTPASLGNSGGPLINRRGQVIGLVTHKSPAENLNVALPSTEITKSSTANAFFDKKNIVIEESTGQTTRGNWRYRAPLPSPPHELARDARRQLKKFTLNLWKKHLNRHKKRLFPNAKGLARATSSMKNEGLAAHFIPTDYQGLNWSLRTLDTNAMRLVNGQEILVSRDLYKGMSIFHINRPNKESPRSFIKNATKIMESFLQVNNIYRKIGRQSFRISSYGKPNKTHGFRDGLKRGWRYSQWTVGFNLSAVELYCTPTPKGAVCLTQSQPLTTRSPIATNMQRLALNSLLINYIGNTAELQRFITSPIAPEFMTTLAITKIDEGFNAEVGNLNITFPFRAHRLDEWLVKVGFTDSEDGRRLASGKIVALNYAPRKDRPNQISLNRLDRPRNSNSTKAQKVEYKKILAGAAPYNGDIIKVGQGYAQFYPANEEVLRTIWLVGCVGISEEGIEKMCDQLSTSD